MSDLSKSIKFLHGVYTAGDFLKAEIGVREALLTWPKDTQLLQLGALTALAIKQVVTAHQRLDTAIERTPMTAELANIKGQIHEASGDWASAEKAYDLSQKLDPLYASARTKRLNLFLVSEQPKLVLAELETDYDFGQMGEVARSQALTDLGRYEEALKVLEPLKLETYSDQIIFQRLKCFAALGRLEDMMQAFESLPELSSLRANALTVVINSFEMRGQNEESLEIIEKEMTREATGVVAQSARLLRRMNQDEKANLELEKRIQSDPNDAHIFSELANSARLAKAFDKSCDLYMRALSAMPGNFLILCGFAQAAISAGRFADAQAALQGALAQSPNNQFLYAMVVTLLREMGEDHMQLYDYQKFVRVYDILPPDGYTDIAIFNAALTKTLTKLHVYQNEPVNQSLRSGTQTEMDLSHVDDPVLNAFFKAMDDPIRDYMASLGWDASHPLRRRNTNAYRISGAWSVKLKENGHHVNHVHPRGWLSSAYYVDVPPSVNERSREGWIKFGEPNLEVEQNAELHVQPVSGRLVLFPSYMWHGTIPFEGSETRLTLPFDVVPA